MTDAAPRRPLRVYGGGEEPDPRFTFANERTFLAWIRTSLGLTAAGVALDSFAAKLPAAAREPLAVALIVLGVTCAGCGYARWMANERALRHGEPLPGFAAGAVLGACLVVTGLTIVGVVVALR